MPKTTKPKTMTNHKPTPEPSRDVEKLIALLRYEMSGVGPGSAEILEDLLATAKDLVLEPRDGGDEFKDQDIERLRQDCNTFAEYLLRGLVAIGRKADAQAIVDSLAARRRECDAKFGTPREIPFDYVEREALSKRWGAGSLESTETH